MKIKAFPLYMGNSGCDYHRIKLPFLFGAPYIDQESHKGFEPAKLLEYMGNHEVIVYNRHFPLGLPLLNELREKHGFKLVVDLDDWVILPDYHPMYKNYKAGDADAILDNIKNADCVTVTTDRLYQKIKEYNKNTHVIPNALPFGYDQFTLKPERQSDIFNFIYTGQSSHLEDVRLMQTDIVRARNLKDMGITLAGFSLNSPITWGKIEKVFSAHNNYTRIPMKPLNEYMSVYDNADCSLVPLCVNEFNSCKSNLKVLEAGSKKLPCIVSYVAPYRDDHDAPVLWVKQPGDWYKHMKYLSDNREYAKDMGEKLYEYVKERFDLLKWNKVRFELYESVINKSLCST